MTSDNLFHKLRQQVAYQRYEPKLCKKDYDHALASYLMHVAERVSIGSYVRTLKFVLLYRDHFKSHVFVTSTT